MKESRVSIEETIERVRNAKAYLFDFDGTLVNLDNLNVDGFVYVFKKMFNLDFTKDDFMKYVSGKSSERGLKEYLDINGIKEFDSQELNSMFNMHKEKLLKEKIDSEVYLLPGIRGFLEYYKGRRMVIVTSSKRNYVEDILSYYNLTGFEKVFDRYDVVRGKPDPLPYENAVEYIGLSKDECIVFEDSFYGLQSSKGAGLFTVGVLNIGWNDDFVYDLADFVIQDYRDIIPQL